nr:hypothetical protein [Tanacetum cinerariifolium]
MGPKSRSKTNKTSHSVPDSSRLHAELFSSSKALDCRFLMEAMWNQHIQKTRDFWQQQHQHNIAIEDFIRTTSSNPPSFPQFPAHIYEFPTLDNDNDSGFHNIQGIQDFWQYQHQHNIVAKEYFHNMSINNPSFPPFPTHVYESSTSESDDSDCSTLTS